MEVYDYITGGTATEKGSDGGHTSFVADRAEVAVLTASKMGCTSQQEVLAYLGKHFRIALPHVQEHEADSEVCPLRFPTTSGSVSTLCKLLVGLLCPFLARLSVTGTSHTRSRERKDRKPNEMKQNWMHALLHISHMTHGHAMMLPSG